MGVGGLNECQFYGVEETFLWKMRRLNVFFGRLLEGETGRQTRVLLTTLVGERRGVFFFISARRLNLFPCGPAEEAS